MARTLLAALFLAALASAARAQAVCAPNADLDSKAFALWIMTGTNPDETPCAAMLAPTSCAPAGHPGAETRTYASADGRYAAVYKIDADGAVTITLKLSGAAGVAMGKGKLSTYPYQRAFYRGVGVDGLQVFDDAAQATKGIGNVLLIPSDALTENGRAMCPAR